MIRKTMIQLAAAGLSIVLFTGIVSVSYAHPGRTDSKGGHTCWTNCEKWGLEYGEYHYHNSQSSSSSSGSSSSRSSRSASSSKNKNNAETQVKPKKPEHANAIKPSAIAIELYVNKEKIGLKNTAVQYDGQLLLPLTEILQIVKVPYSVKDGKVFIQSKDGQIGIPTKNNSKRITKNGNEVVLATPIIQYDGRVMVSMQMLRMLNDYKFDYKKTEKALYITSS